MTHDSKELAPKPAPDAMREAPLDLAWEGINALGGVPEQNNSYDQGCVDTVVKALEIVEKLGGSDPAPKRSRLSALAPPPDGAAEPDDDWEARSERSYIDNTKSPPSDDVRSALADRELDRLHAYVKHHYTCATTGHDRTKFERDLASIVKGLRSEIAALRSAPVSAPAALEADIELIGVALSKSGHPSGVSHAFYRIADALRSAPAVGVTQETIAQIIEPEAFLPETDQHNCVYRMMTLAQGRALALLKAGAILAVFPAPDATVSEPVAYRWRYETRPDATLPWSFVAAPMAGDITGLEVEPLYTSPQHIGIEAAVTESINSACDLVRDAMIEECAKLAQQFVLDMSKSQLDDRDIELIVRGANEASAAIETAIRSLTGAKP